MNDQLAAEAWEVIQLNHFNKERGIAAIQAAIEKAFDTQLQQAVDQAKKELQCTDKKNGGETK